MLYAHTKHDVMTSGAPPLNMTQRFGTPSSNLRTKEDCSKKNELVNMQSRNRRSFDPVESLPEELVVRIFRKVDAKAW